jgi:hypothetical protein
VTVEITPLEAEILIAVLTGAEGIFPYTSPELSEALKELRPWRSALVQAYIRERASAISDVAEATKDSDGSLLDG